MANELEALSKQIGELQEQLKSLQTSLEEKDIQGKEQASKIESLNKQIKDLVKKANGSSVTTEAASKKEPIKLSDKAYEVDGKKYKAKFPRMFFQGQVYTSEELHDKVNAKVLKEMIEGFKKEENKFFTEE